MRIGGGGGGEGLCETSEKKCKVLAMKSTVLCQLSVASEIRHSFPCKEIVNAGERFMCPLLLQHGDQPLARSD